MCGISGIINYNNTKVEHDEIKSINDLILHRGPDDEGFYFGNSFAFGHRRLSILDLSKDGHQPMHYLDKYTITYNGEIYNYIELRKELIQDGYVFHSDTDTEVILAAYDKWGESCVNKFNGMWAFALYDKKKQIIFSSRDRFGIKPFYYTEINDKFIFGSEIKQLLIFYTDRYVNKKILMDYLVLGLEDHTNGTFFENIFKLEQSHNLIYNLKTHKYRIERYYDIQVNDFVSDLDLPQSIEQYKHSLEESIRLRLRSDVKVGTCLSGGLDSSSIAGIAAKLNQEITERKLVAIHAKSTQKSNDESQFAKLVSNHCDLEMKVVEPSLADFIDHIDDVILTQEEPMGGPSLFMQYFVMKKAKQENCTVMLDGQGGDETLLGYERYYPAYLKSLGFFRGIKGIWHASKNSKLSIKQLLFYSVYFTNALVRIKRLKRKYSFLKHQYMDLIDSKCITKISKNYLDIFSLQKQELYTTQLPHLLKYEDKNSMRHSIETRLPFIDYQLLETALSIPNTYKIYKGWTKFILRKSVENILPISIVWRKNKFGFEAPTQSWLNSIQDTMQLTIEKSNIIQSLTKEKIPFSSLDEKQKWKLFNIAKWEELYNVKIS